MTLVDFYATSPAPCPYLPDRLERKVLAELRPGSGRGIYDRLARAGFRRSHNFAYRPNCGLCSACLPVRVVVEDFTPTRSMRRTAKRNADLQARIVGPAATDEQFALFARYIDERHGDGEMAGMAEADFRAMVEDSTVATSVVEFRRAGELVAAMLVDSLQDGFSAVYSFFAPDLHADSVGTWMVLWLIERARRAKLPWVYLGYWVPGSPKMHYKARFRPLQALGQRGWQEVDDELRTRQTPVVSACGGMGADAGAAGDRM